MAPSETERPDLPAFMSWDELESLPEDLAAEIELWDGRVVWARRGPAEHQHYTVEFRNALRHAARNAMTHQPERCWRTDVETNVFLGPGKSNFATPDFLVYRCLDGEYQDIWAGDALLVGEVLSPSNKQTDIEARKARYAGARIPWYWEVTLARQPRGIATVRAYALEHGHGLLPAGVTPLRAVNYIQTGEWSPAETADGIVTDFPFPIRIPWADLDY
jgi:Uma2 family endonuclease